jgi:CRISPR-associated protein Csb3
MTETEPSIRVDVDPTNPGQFFACCGLLELADRLWNGAEGWFERDQFLISASGELPTLIKTLAEAPLSQINPNDKTASPVIIGLPTRPLRIDWWHGQDFGARDLKVWAGTMESVRIARAMQRSLRDTRFHSSKLFDVGVVAYDPDDETKKVEPFYFDARRGPNAHSRDVGFSPNDLHVTTSAFPAVELLCLVGLQRCRPARTKRSHVFDYSLWSRPLPPSLCASAACGVLASSDRRAYRFECWYRTGQKKHKAFRSAVPVPTGEPR